MAGQHVTLCDALSAVAADTNACANRAAADFHRHKAAPSYLVRDIKTPTSPRKALGSISHLSNSQVETRSTPIVDRHLQKSSLSDPIQPSQWPRAGGLPSRQRRSSREQRQEDHRVHSSSLAALRRRWQLRRRGHPPSRSPHLQSAVAGGRSQAPRRRSRRGFGALTRFVQSGHPAWSSQGSVELEKGILSRRPAADYRSRRPSRPSAGTEARKGPEAQDRHRRYVPHVSPSRTAACRSWVPESPPTSTSRKLTRHLLAATDAREPSELQATGRIPGAINVPITTAPDSFHVPESEFADRFGYARPGKDQSLLFYCKAGVRSRAAAALAGEAGWKDVGEYPGSWMEWEKNGGEVER